MSLDWLARKVVNGVILKFNEKLFVTKSIGELLFDGYEPEFADFVASRPMKLPFDTPMSMDKKFALLKDKNNTSDGKWTVHTGIDNIMKIASVNAYKNQSELNCWNQNECNRIQGTDGMMFHPFISPEEKLYIFTPFLSRSIYMKFETHAEVRGIKTLKYVFPEELLRAPNSDEKLACFCAHNSTRNDTDICDEDGLLDLSQCNNGLPLVVSMPHFYPNNAKLIKKFYGIKPSEQKHKTFINITGFVIDGAFRFQLNIHFRSTYGVKSLENLKYGIYPVVWMEEKATIDEDSAEQLSYLVHNRIALFKTLSLVVLVF
ncbi:lysosome membrane protein 2-like protein, partial [Dinothrombium tinctorium]